MNCVLIVPRVVGLSTRWAFAPQVPLGHVAVGSALMREGHDVTLIDTDLRRMTPGAILRDVRLKRPGCILIGHPASTVAHVPAMRLAGRLRAAMPAVPIIYGGLHPTYHADEVLDSGDVDFVVRHEAESVTVDLVRHLSSSPHTAADTPGVASRGRRSPLPAATIVDLDAVRPLWRGPWGLHRYRAYGRRSAVVQFSRGCPRRCSYCGQWDFWKTWRHRSVESFVAEVDELAAQGTRLFWIADENWGIRQDLFLRLLEGLRSVQRGQHMIVAMESAHVARDVEHLRLYREAGITQIMLGLDGEDEGLLGANPKRRNAYTLARVIERMHDVGMTSIVNHFMPADGTGRPAEMAELQSCRADFYNTLHPTPHRWTEYGRRAAGHIANADSRDWDYRHPVLGESDWELIAKRWRAKEVELCLNVRARLRVFLSLFLRQRPLPGLMLRSVALTSRVFVIETVKLTLDTAIVWWREPCPWRRRRHADQSSPARRLVVLDRA